jgi:hypothetical protein
VTLRGGCERLGGLDADDGRNHRNFKAAVGLAQELLDGLAIEPPGDLLCGGDREGIARDLGMTAALELVLERFAFRLGTLQHAIGVPECISKSLVGQIVKARCGRSVDSLEP